MLCTVRSSSGYTVCGTAVFWHHLYRVTYVRRFSIATPSPHASTSIIPSMGRPMELSFKVFVNSKSKAVAKKQSCLSYVLQPESPLRVESA